MLNFDSTYAVEVNYDLSVLDAIMAADTYYVGVMGNALFSKSMGWRNEASLEKDVADLQVPQVAAGIQRVVVTLFEISDRPSGEQMEAELKEKGMMMDPRATLALAEQHPDLQRKKKFQASWIGTDGRYRRLGVLTDGDPKADEARDLSLIKVKNEEVARYKYLAAMPIPNPA